jgi:sarcosine oxidase delta subunit
MSTEAIEAAKTKLVEDREQAKVHGEKREALHLGVAEAQAEVTRLEKRLEDIQADYNRYMWLKNNYHGQRTQEQIQQNDRDIEQCRKDFPATREALKAAQAAVKAAQQAYAAAPLHCLNSYPLWTEVESDLIEQGISGIRKAFLMAYVASTKRGGGPFSFKTYAESFFSAPSQAEIDACLTELKERYELETENA